MDEITPLSLPARDNGSKLMSTLLVVVVLVVAGIGMWSYRSSHRSSSAAVATTAATQTTNGGYDPRIGHPNTTFNLTIDNNRIVSGPSKISVKLGDSVRISMKAGGTKEIGASLPGYGIITESAPEDTDPGGFSFIADKAGSFPFYSIDQQSTTAVPVLLGTITVTK